MDWIYEALGLGQVDPLGLLLDVGTLLLAGLIAIPIGLDRERATQSMGLRTFPLVAVAAAAFAMIGRDIIGQDAPDAHARILAGIMTGVGFLGGGAILKGDEHIKGTATAASIWATAGIGAAVAHRRLEIAVVICVVSVILLRFVKPLKRGVDDDPSHELETDADDASSSRRGEPSPAE